MNINELKGSFQYAMHGNGVYKGLRQTNSKEALMFWYNKGIRIFEIDMASTDDNKFVAVAHDLKENSLRRLELFNAPVNKTYEWFINQKLFSISTKGLTPLSLSSIIDLLQTNQDLLVMFDLYGLFTKEEAYNFVNSFTYLSDDDVWNRVLFETYNIDMVQGITSANKQANIIYCVRFEKNCNQPDAITPKELIDNNVRFISYPWCYAKMHPGEIMDYDNAEITVFSRTKFNTKNHQLKKSGVSVNIIAIRFDGLRIIYQMPLYFLTYIKRALVKAYIFLTK